MVIIFLVVVAQQAKHFATNYFLLIPNESSATFSPLGPARFSETSSPPTCVI